MAAWIGRVSGLVSNLKRGAQVALAAVVILAFVGTTVLIFHERSLANNQYIGPEPTWNLPFPAGTQVALGISGLHAGNFSSIPGYTFSNNGESDASLDLGFAGLARGDAPVPAIALAPGTVLATWPECHVVLVDHYHGWWAIYLHLTNISVNPGERITSPKDTPLGVPTMNVNPNRPCYEFASYVHVHFALLNQTGPKSASYVSMNHRTLCGMQVESNGTLAGTPQHYTSFTIPVCPNQAPDLTAVQTNQAGHVMAAIGQAGVLDANLKPLTARCTSASSTALVYQGDHVVVIDNTAIKNVDTGEEFYKVAYPDPCEPGRDFSPDSNIYVPMSGIPPNVAVGYVSNSVLREVNSARAVDNGAVWRDCWGPDRCGDAHQVAGTVLASADSPYLYAWWTGQYWDPHWFHVKDAHGHGAAVYGRYWTVAYTSAPIVGSTSTPVSCSKSALFSACTTPTSASQPPVSQPPTPQPPAPSPTAMPYTPTWHSALNEFAPSCNLPSGEMWYNPLPSGTYTNCASSGFIQQQTSQYLYAETDLKYFNNQTYDQSNFRTSVQATFLNPGDAATYAALIVQTPQAANAAGGYIFGVNSAGQWRLQYVQSGSSIPTVASGQVGGSSTPTIAVQVRGGQLTAWVNGQQVGVWPDGLGGANEMGIMTQKDGQPSSSQVQYNHFTLDFWY